MSQVPPPPDSPPPPPPNYPPPSSPPPGGSAAFSPGAAFSYGWAAFWKNAGPMVSLTAVIVVVALVLNLIGRASGNVGVFLLFALLGGIAAFILSMGIIRAALAVTKGGSPDFSMLTQTDHLGAFVVGAILFALGFYVGLALCIVPGVIFLLAFMFFGFAILDSDREISGTDGLKVSNQLTSGHKGEVLVLVLILFGVNIVPGLFNSIGTVGLIIAAILQLFTYGITALIVAAAYRMLKGQPLAPVG